MTTINDTERWEEKSPGLLIEHILMDFHRPLDTELPRLESLARKVHEAHQEKASDVLSGVLATFVSLKAELEQHMVKEEQILFPMIQSGQGAMADGPIGVMEQEHESANWALKKLRELTNDYQVPKEACDSWKDLWTGLESLEGSLHQHIHLESDILFPQALQSL